MNIQQTIEFLLKHNDQPVSHAAVIDNLIRLIADGYSVIFSRGDVSNYAGDGYLPAVHVLVSRDGEWVFEATEIIISEAMAEVYQNTPEVQP